MSLPDNVMPSDTLSEHLVQLHDDSSEETFDFVPLVYDDSLDTAAITNVLLIDDSVQEYQHFVDGCNANTFPIVYNYHSDRNELKSLLARKFSNIQRIAFVFHNAGMNSKLFLNNQCFFSGSESPDNFSENFQVLVDIIRDFHVGHVDYLACNSLEYESWKQYYELLKNAANVVIGASDDATGNIQYGGDWVMETTNQDVKTMYFNESIEEYTKTLATSTISASTTVTNANLNNTNLYTWPITISGGTASSRVVITFGDDINLNNVNKYFIVGSDYITVDGGNKTVTISGVTNYPGLIQNGTGNASNETKITNGKSNITVQNIKISSSNSTLQYSGGWICQVFYGNSAIGTNVISNCTNNNGTIRFKSGGIAGVSTFAFSSGTNTITNCLNSGNITYYQAGGIVGRRFAYSSPGTNTITNCSNSSSVYDYTGGIAGVRCFDSASGRNKITDCTNNGIILGLQAGGIAGNQFAQETTGSSVNTIEKCSNNVDISGNYAGGIAGPLFALLSSGTNTITDCTNNGIISGNYAGGIVSSSFALLSSGTNTITDCTNNGIISGNYAGGIVSSSFAESTVPGSVNTIEKCSNSGNISGNYAGGIAATAFALRSLGTNKITDCTNNGIISGQSAGGIAGKFTGYNSSGTNTITNCVNNGDISGNFTGGIAGGAIAYTDASNISPTVIISNSYSIGIIRNTTGTGGICAGFDGKTLDASNNFIDASYATIATAIINNCYALYGNIKSSTQSDKLAFKITNTYEANGAWSSQYALQNLLLKDASDTYIWAYQKLNGVDQTSSPFVLYSMNVNNTTITKITQFVSKNHFALSKNNYVKIIPRKYGIYINNVTSRGISPALPDGLKFSSITGTISGTPVSTSQSKKYKIWTTQTIDNVVTTYRKTITIEIV